MYCTTAPSAHGCIYYGFYSIKVEIKLNYFIGDHSAGAKLQEKSLTTRVSVYIFLPLK
jgi:hypothetical protein